MATNNDPDNRLISQSKHSGWSSKSLAEIKELLNEINPLFVQAAKEVDESLLDWYLSLSPMERLETCTRATRALSGWKRVTASHRITTLKKLRHGD